MRAVGALVVARRDFVHGMLLVIMVVVLLVLLVLFVVDLHLLFLFVVDLHLLERSSAAVYRLII